MKKQILLLSMMLVAGSNLYGGGGDSSDGMWNIPEVAKKGLKIALWLFRPFEKLDEKNEALRNKFFDDMERQKADLEKYNKPEYQTKVRFDPRYRNYYKYQHLKDVKSVDSVQWKHMNLLKYGPLCSDGQYITKRLHSSPGAYIATGLWYASLVAGLYQGAKRVRHYYKKKAKQKKKLQKRVKRENRALAA